MNRSLLRAGISLLFLLFWAPAFADTSRSLPKGVSAGPCVEGICQYSLPNGLRVLLLPDATKPTVTVNLVYGVGSLHENYGGTGMAHLLEHLLFKGTPTRANILGGDPLKARLADRIRQKEGLSYGVGSLLQEDNSREGRDDNGHLMIQAIAAPQNVPKVEAAIREEFSRLVKEGVTEQEVRDAVQARLVGRQQGRAEDAVLASISNNHLQYGRDWAFEADRDAAYAALTAETVNAAIRKHFKPDSLSVFVAGDFKE